MKTGVGSATEAHWLVLVLQVILDVAHLVVYGEELLHCHRGALLDSAKGLKKIIDGFVLQSWRTIVYELFYTALTHLTAIIT